MSFHSRLRPLFIRLRPRIVRVAIPLGVLAITAMIGAAGLGFRAHVEPARWPAMESSAGSRDGEDSSRSNDQTDKPSAGMASANIEPLDRLTAGADPDEVTRQLEDLPAGRWSYAFHAAAGRSSLPAPAPPPPHRVIPSLPASALGFAWPLRGVITSAFDDRHPLGIDIAPSDAPGLVLAARDGTVIAAGGDPCCGYGYYVMLDHGGGVTSIYGHLQETPPFRPGERIERGTVLGVAGDTGHSFGVHLHFEVRVNGVPVSPEAALTEGEIVPLPARAAAEERTAPDPQNGDPHGETSGPGDSDPEDDSAPAAVEDSAPAEPSSGDGHEEAPADPEPINQSPADHRPSPIAASEATPQPTAAQRAPGPSSAPDPLPSRAESPAPSPAIRASPSPSARTPPSPSPSPSISPSPSVGPSPSPRCETVRFPTTDGFVVLRSDGIGVRSLTAERCDGGDSTTVVVQSIADERCTADVVEPSAVRRLAPLPAAAASDGPAASIETRWRVETDTLHAGAEVHVACRPSSLPD